MPCCSRVRAALRAILANSSWRECIVSDGVEIDNAAITRCSRAQMPTTIGACDGRWVICIAHATVSRTGPVLAEGARLAGHASALGKYLMAQFPWPKLKERIEQHGSPTLTPKTVSRPRSLSQAAHLRAGGTNSSMGTTIPSWLCMR
jgi:DNA-binding IclR family transcriptional regulator